VILSGAIVTFLQYQPQKLRRLQEQYRLLHDMTTLYAVVCGYTTSRFCHQSQHIVQRCTLRAGGHHRGHITLCRQHALCSVKRWMVFVCAELLRFCATVSVGT
jgi:hypothetical protein